MALRLQRVLIACSLPTILAIVSFYWLRKRRKAVVIGKQSTDQTSNSTSEATHPTPASIQSQHISALDLKPIEHSDPIHIGSPNQSLWSQSSQSYCELRSFDTQSDAKTMRYRENNSRSAVEAIETNGQTILVSDTNSLPIIRMDNEDANHRSEQKRQQLMVSHNNKHQLIDSNGNGCTEMNENELNAKYNASDDKLSVKFNNLSLNNGDHKDIKSCNDVNDIEAQNQMNNNHIMPSNEITIEVNACPTTGTGSEAIPSSPTQPSHSNTDNNNGSPSTCSSSASQCLLMTNGYDTGDVYHNYPDSLSNGGTHSPPHSAFSDVQSEGSSDSGKGGSNILHATPVEHRTLIGTHDETVIYQLEIPQLLCGRLIGEKGRFVTQIKRDTGTTVVINQHMYASDMKICTLTGTRPAIKDALIMIRMRFPINHYPDVSLQQINLINASQTCSLPQTCQLQIPSGISCDVILSSLVSAGHFFLQQPTHPTYPSLSRLDHLMTQTYSQQNTPFLPNIHTGMVCTAAIMGGWYRAVITKVYDNDECDVMFVDYGGFSQLPVSSLRQIRYDFMTLPFQSSECYLANIEPIDSQVGWTTEANALFEELAQGQILQATVMGYADNGIPLVNLFKIQGISTVFINQELVNRSHAQWVVGTA